MFAVQKERSAKKLALIGMIKKDHIEENRKIEGQKNENEE